MQTIKQTLTNKERGFTLIELLVVIAIIAVLAALILAALTSAQKGSRDSKRRSDVSQIKTASVQYQADNNIYAASIAAMVPTYLGVAPANPGGTGDQSTYAYFGNNASSFCVSIRSERNTTQFIGASPTGQFNDKTVACTTPTTY